MQSRESTLRARTLAGGRDAARSTRHHPLCRHEFARFFRGADRDEDPMASREIHPEYAQSD